MELSSKYHRNIIDVSSKTRNIIELSSTYHRNDTDISSTWRRNLIEISFTQSLDNLNGRLMLIARKSSSQRCVPWCLCMHIGSYIMQVAYCFKLSSHRASFRAAVVAFAENPWGEGGLALASAVIASMRRKRFNLGLVSLLIIHCRIGRRISGLMKVWGFECDILNSCLSPWFTRWFRFACLSDLPHKANYLYCSECHRYSNLQNVLW